MKPQNQRASELSDRLLRDAVVERIWKRDVGAWGAAAGSPDAQSIQNRLGWLDVGSTMPPHMAQVHRLGDQVRHEGFEAAFLLGMGGSSLCAEVLRSVFGSAEGFPQLSVLDTTDELTLRNAAARMTPSKTLFIVASKSGGTVEVASMERFFWQEVSRVLGSGAGRHFVAITDPGTGAAASWQPAAVTGRFSSIRRISADDSRRCLYSASSPRRSSVRRSMRCSPAEPPWPRAASSTTTPTPACSWARSSGQRRWKGATS